MRGLRQVGLVAVLGLVAVTACGEDEMVAPEPDAALLAVFPQGGSSGVDPTGPIVIEFTHVMMEGMEEYADVHEGGLEGPLVAGAWSWNGDRTKLTFTPSQPLKSQTQYVIHIGGGMQDHLGQHINYEQHGSQMGGQWMTEQMYQGGQHGHGMGGQGGMEGGHGDGMGTGWVHPTNGSYGMVFYFRTA